MCRALFQNRFNSNFGHKKTAGPGRSIRACGANSAYHTELGGFPIRLFQCGNATLCKLKLQNIYIYTQWWLNRPARKKVRRQVHWTRGPSNVSRRIRLTPRNHGNRSSLILGVQPPVGHITSTLCPKQLCPKTSPSIYAAPKCSAQTCVQIPVAKGLLLQRFGGHGASPRRVPRPNRLTVWAVPRIAADPKTRRKQLSRPTSLDKSTV